MKTLITILGIACIAATAQAGEKKLKPGDNDLELFLANGKAMAEKKPWDYNEAKLTARFAEMDADNDGIATAAERKAWHASKKK